MPVRKSNRINIYFSDNSITVLQALGYLDGKKRATSKSISKFVSDLVIDCVNSHPNDTRAQVQIKMLMKRLQMITDERNRADKEISSVIEEIRRLRQGTRR